MAAHGMWSILSASAHKIPELKGGAHHVLRHFIGVPTGAPDELERTLYRGRHYRFHRTIIAHRRTGQRIEDIPTYHRASMLGKAGGVLPAEEQVRHG